MGSIEKELAPFKAKIARLEALRKALRKALRGFYADSDPAVSFTAEGERFVAMVGACGTERSIDTAALVKALGAKAVLGIASVTIKAAQNAASFLPDGVIISDQTGHRSLKIYEKGNPA